jgi:HSP20 family protein
MTCFNLFDTLLDKIHLQDENIDIWNDGDYLTLEVEIPGYKKEDISIEMEDQKLIISAERKEKEHKYILKGRQNSFKRSFSLPNGLSDEITAKLEDGILTVNIKIDKTKKKIEIKAG